MVSYASPNAFSCPWTIFFNDGCLSFSILQNQKKVYREGGETVFPTGLEDVDEKKRSMIASSGRDERSTRVAHLPTPNTRTTTSFLVSPLCGPSTYQQQHVLIPAHQPPLRHTLQLRHFTTYPQQIPHPTDILFPKPTPPRPRLAFFFSFVIFSVFPYAFPDQSSCPPTILLPGCLFSQRDEQLPRIYYF